MTFLWSFSISLTFPISWQLWVFCASNWFFAILRRLITCHCELREPLRNNCHPNLCVSLFLVDSSGETVRNIDNSMRLLASPRAIARNEHQPAATFVPRLCRLWEKFVERRIRARHSLHVFLATHAREICRKRLLNHNRNGERIALRPKCTLAIGSRR